MKPDEPESRGENLPEGDARDFTTFQDLELSLWQSSVDEVFTEPGERRQRAVQGTEDYCEAVFNSPPGESPVQRLRGNVPALVSGYHHLRAAQRATEDANLRFNLREFRLEIEKFEEPRDVTGWASCGKVYIKYLLQHRRGKGYRSWKLPGPGRSRISFSVIEEPQTLPEIARVAIMGDWGTGEPRAIRVFQKAVAMRPHVIIHLGDIYYSGTKRECRERFYDVVRGPVGFDGPIFTLAGNHDYYAAGTGYYHLLNSLNKNPNGRNWGPMQEASYFCLRNRYWQLLAMDTGFNDSVPGAGYLRKKFGHPLVTSLRDDEIEWHRDKLQNARGRKTILFSHHQLFSAYEEIGLPHGSNSFNLNLLQYFGAFFGKPQPGESEIRAWFWGHEHDYMSFEKGHLGLGLGICAGNGAIPVRCGRHPKPLRSPFAGLPLNLRNHALGRTGRYYNNGFSILHLQRAGARVEHFEVDSRLVARKIAEDRSL